MRFMVPMCAALAGAVLIYATPAAADVTPIQVEQGKPFKHKPSGIVVADTASGLPRSAVAEFDDKQLDVIIDYRSPDQGEVTTLYLFRKVTGDVPVWFDRIERTVQASTHFGTLTPAIPAMPFTPIGQTGARGLHAAFSASGTPWKSSAAAITSTSDWYVAIRASSRTLTADQLLARLDQTFAAIRWPKEKAAPPAVTAIADCPSSLVQGEDAQPAKVETGALLLSTGLAAAMEDDKSPHPQVRWCRDPYQLDGAGVYRPDGAADRYLIAYQDAGRGVVVGPNELAQLLGSANGSAERTFTVELIDVDRQIGFGDFKTLPKVAQALWAAQNGTRLYSASTWGKKDIEINSDAVK